MRIEHGVSASGGTGERVAREPLTGRVTEHADPSGGQRTGRRARDPDPETGPEARNP